MGEGAAWPCIGAEVVEIHRAANWNTQEQKRMGEIQNWLIEQLLAR